MSFLIGLIAGVLIACPKRRLIIPEDYGVEPADTTMTQSYYVRYKPMDFGYEASFGSWEIEKGERTLLSQVVYRFFFWERGFWI